MDWEGLIRALNAAGYEGALAVEFKDLGMDREHGAAEACARAISDGETRRVSAVSCALSNCSV